MTQKHELYAVLISLPGGDTLLLPNAVVAEVLSADALQPASGPEWVAGRCFYNGRQLPVVNFEVLNGRPAVEAGRRTRVTVLHAISGKLDAGQFALLGQGYPHLITLNRNALTREPLEDNDRDELVLTRVKIANTAAGIPNLDTLEDELSRARVGAVEA